MIGTRLREQRHISVSEPIDWCQLQLIGIANRVANVTWRLGRATPDRRLRMAGGLANLVEHSLGSHEIGGVEPLAETRVRLGE
jgi:hypothetical protein